MNPFQYGAMGSLKFGPDGMQQGLPGMQQGVTDAPVFEYNGSRPGGPGEEGMREILERARGGRREEGPRKGPRREGRPGPRGGDDFLNRANDVLSELRARRGERGPRGQRPEMGPRGPEGMFGRPEMGPRGGFPGGSPGANRPGPMGPNF
jgi:hypothetical protein